MWAYASATLRHALRSPVSWVLLALGVFFGWFALTAAVLAIDDVSRQAASIGSSTAHLAAALLTLWVLGRSLEEDRHSGFAAAADASRAGPRGRVLGRWVGAALAGALLGVGVALAIALTTRLPSTPLILLLSTSIQVSAMVGAWAVLLGSLWRGGGAMLAALVLFVLGHLPWGSPAFLAGRVGFALGTWLPGPRSSGGLDSLGYTSLAVAGLLLVSLASARPADS